MTDTSNQADAGAPPCPPRRSAWSSAPGSSATASSATSAGSAGPTWCRSTRARCPTPAAPPVTPRTSSSRPITTRRWRSSPSRASAQYDRPRAQQHLRRHRGRPQAGAARGVQPPHDLGQGVGHRRPLAHAGRDQGARPVHQRGDPPRRVLHPERVVRRLAASRHADARRGRRRRRTCRCSPTPRCSTSRSSTARVPRASSPTRVASRPSTW